MSKIRPMGRNSAVMELNALLSKGEQLRLTGNDFEAGSIGQVEAVLGQTKGTTKVHIKFIQGGLSELARVRISTDIKTIRTNQPNRQSPGRQGRLPGRATGYAGRRKERRRNEELDFLRQDSENVQLKHQVGSPVAKSDGVPVVADDNSPRIVKEIAKDVEIPVFATKTNVPRQGFGALIQMGISTLDGGIPGGLRGNADRPGIIDRPVGYMSQKDHVEAMNLQADHGFGDSWDGEALVSVHQDNAVGAEGNYRRSDYAQERMIPSTDEATEQARVALQEDGINPQAKVRGLEKWGRRR